MVPAPFLRVDLALQSRSVAHLLLVQMDRCSLCSVSETWRLTDTSLIAHKRCALRQSCNAVRYARYEGRSRQATMYAC